MRGNAPILVLVSIVVIASIVVVVWGLSDRSSPPVDVSMDASSLPTPVETAEVAQAGISPTEVAQEPTKLDSARVVDTRADPKPRLEWSPEPILEQGVFDLCEDEQAIAAGLDGGDLANERVALGISCESATNRYGYLGNDGNLVLGDTERVAGSAGDELTASAPLALLMGYRGPSYSNFQPPEGSTNPLVVDPASLRTIDGVTYGLVVNTSDQLAQNVVVEHAGVRSEHPLSIQPGEAAPFVLSGDAGGVSPTEISVVASLSESVDLNRAILVSAAPGLWVGPREQIPAPAGLIDITTAPREVAYYETSLEVRAPSSHVNQAAAIDTRTINGVEVVVAFLDEQGAVLGVIHPQAVAVTGDHQANPVSTITVGESLTVGFLVPPEATNFAIWVGGTEL